MTLRRLGQTDIHIAPLVLGTNTAGWTADEETSFAIFDAFAEAGFSALDTADVYSRWVPGNDSESERIIGRWMKARGNRDKVHVFTKVGSDMGQGRTDLSARWIMKAVEDSLKRLQTDYIDLYQSHWPDPTVSHEETLEAYDRLIKAGKVRWIGASNYGERLLSEALKTSDKKDLPRYQTLQNEYNLLTREKYEGDVQELVLREGLSLMPYYSLSAGFLTGKYRTETDLEQSPRGKSVSRYMDERGLALLQVMDGIVAETGATHTELALAWLNAQPGVVGPLASASTVEQLAVLTRGARLELSEDVLARLTAAVG